MHIIKVKKDNKVQLLKTLYINTPEPVLIAFSAIIVTIALLLIINLVGGVN